MAFMGLFLTTTIIAEVRHWGGMEANVWLVSSIEAVAYAALLWIAAYAVAEKKHIRWTVGVLGTGAVLLGAAAGFTQNPLLGMLQSTATLLFLSFIVWLLIAYLFHCRDVDLDTLAASVCVYLTLGLVWLSAYSILVYFQPEAFRDVTAIDEDEQFALMSLKSAHGLYFSFVTLTTLGYGDMAPATPMARLLAWSEAVVGQLFLTMLVARLVGLHLKITVNHTGDRDVFDGEDNENAKREKENGTEENDTEENDTERQNANESSRPSEAVPS